ncbi:uncharacterized protein LOC133800710 isoform X2 [Humulus lupulus]|uniref:uncharacterized protein LOC133800710 isoform X2 n=1 Tax=Humulus lupulus TaxID=3486 RepID=UPI002B404C26|nr:uncharacterized protein LOC133800710 isoform X2 [Humulus lupulus]
MALSVSPTTPYYTCSLSFRHERTIPFSLHINELHHYPLLCAAATAKSQTGPVEKNRHSSSANKKRKKKGKRAGDQGDDNDDIDSEGLSFSEVEIVQSESVSPGVEASISGSDSRSLGNYATPMPKPPAGFVVDDHGKVLMASNKRIATIVDPTNNVPLECVIRRVFKSSRGDDCMLLCPVDMPVQILKSTNIEGWSAVSDEEVEAILPSAAYALAKIHMHLVHSGFCYTARGGFCYSEDDIFDFRTDDGQDVDGLPTEGVEITCFHMDGTHYMIYTPSDPLLFVAVKDNNGVLQIADDLLVAYPLRAKEVVHRFNVKIHRIYWMTLP